MTVSSIVNIKKYKQNYLSCYIMKDGFACCFRCAIENKSKIIAQKILWNSEDLNSKCDYCLRKIQDVS